MRTESFLFTYPVYAFLLKDGTSAIYHRHGNEICLPLFTDQDAARTYLQRSEINECQMRQLRNPAELKAFIRNPPRGSGDPEVKTIAMDPIDVSPPTLRLLDAQLVISQLPD